MVRIRLIGNEEDRANTFYIIMCNGNTYSNVRDEFVISEYSFKILKRKRCKFEIC